MENLIFLQCPFVTFCDKHEQDVLAQLTMYSQQPLTFTFVIHLWRSCLGTCTIWMIWRRQTGRFGGSSSSSSRMMISGEFAPLWCWLMTEDCWHCVWLQFAFSINTMCFKLVVFKMSLKLNKWLFVIIMPGKYFDIYTFIAFGLCQKYVF